MQVVRLIHLFPYVKCRAFSFQGKANESETKQRVGAIHELKEKLKKETENLKSIKNKLREVQDRQKNEKEVSPDNLMKFSIK